MSNTQSDLKSELKGLGIDLSALENKRPAPNSLDSFSTILQNILGPNETELSWASGVTIGSLLNDLDESDYPNLVFVNQPQTKEPQVKYQYFYSHKDDRFHCKRHHGVITLATILKNGGMEYGISFCSPEDKYDKPMGKDVAINRLLDKPQKIKYIHKLHTHNIGKRYNHKSITFQLVTDMINNIKVPDWAKDILGDHLEDLVRDF